MRSQIISQNCWTMEEKNQIHNPRQKKHTTDNLGNERVRLWYKSGNSTMLLTSGLTKWGAQSFNRNLKVLLSKYGCKLEGTLIITR